MPRCTWIPWLSALALMALVGCAENPMVLQGRVAESKRQQDILTRQNQQLADRAAGLGPRQPGSGHPVGPGAAGDPRLGGAIGCPPRTASRGDPQVAQIQADKQSSEQKAQALSASLHRQSGVSISPNNSFLQTLPAIHQPDVYVRRDGDVIRVELPGNRLFESGGRGCVPAPPTSSPTWPPNAPRLSRPDHRHRGAHRQRSGGGRPVAK